METQFEIHTRLEKKHYVDFYCYMWRKRMITVVISAILAILLLGLGVFDTSVHSIVLGIWCAFYGVWLFFRPWMAASKSIKQDLNFAGTEGQESVTKFGAEIFDETKNQTATVPYDKLEKVHITDNVILLVDTRKMTFIMDRNGFTKGTLQEFLPFLQEKCPQLKLPKW